MNAKISKERKDYIFANIFDKKTAEEMAAFIEQVLIKFYAKNSSYYGVCLWIAKNIYSFKTPEIFLEAEKILKNKQKEQRKLDRFNALCHEDELTG